MNEFYVTQRLENETIEIPIHSHQKLMNFPDNDSVWTIFAIAFVKIVEAAEIKKLETSHRYLNWIRKSSM